VAASFSLTGSLRIVPRWDDDLNTTTVTDTATVNLAFALADGTGDDQANGYYKDVVTIAASGTATIDLRALPLTIMGGTGTLSLAKVKALLIVNRSTTASLAVNGSTTNRWTALSAGAMTLGPEGVLYVTHLNAGYATTATDKVIAITNNGASAADVEVYIVGVKS
jgi:hypothetical protein